MKKMTKRTLSLLLVVAMICSLGVLALADDTAIIFNPSSLTVYVGKTATTTANLNNFSSYAGKTVTWTSYNADAVSVSGTTTVGTDGKLTATVTGKAATPAPVTVTANVLDSSGTTVLASGTFTVTVNADSVKSVVIKDSAGKTVSGTTLYVAKGSAVSLNVSNTLESGNTANAADNVAIWSTNNTAAATISNDSTAVGSITVQAVGDGSADITATAASGAAATVKITVATQPAVTASSATTFYKLTSDTAPTLTVTSVPEASVTYQWYKDTASNGSFATKASGSTASNASYTAPVSDAGTTYYRCRVNNGSGVYTDSAVFTVIVHAPCEVVVSPSTSTVYVNGSTTLTATITNYKVNSTGTGFDQTPATTGTVSWTSDSSSSISMSPTSASVYSTSSYGYATTTVAGKALNNFVTVTAKYGSITGTATVKVTNYTVNASATVPVGSSAFAMTDTNGYTAASVDSQIKSGISNAYYVQFSTGAATGTAYGTFSASSTTYYALGTGWFNNLSSVTFTPGSKAGSYVVPYTVYDSSYNTLATGTLTITVKDAATGTGDISYNVKVSNTVSLTDSDFESWYENQTSASYSLISVRFNSLPTAGTMKYSGSSSSLYFNTSTDYYTNGNGSGTSPKYLANVSYTAPSTAGNYAVSFTCTGKYGTSTRTVSGTLMFCVNKGTVTDITYKAVYGQDLSLAESDFTAVYKTAISSTATSPKFTIRFVTLPSKGTLYRDGYTTSAYKVTAGTSYNVNAAIATAYDVNDITYVPGKYTSGSETVTYQAYDAAGTLQYTGNIVFNYTTNNKPMSCYSEGYTFAKGDFVSTGDTDPVSYVMFTGISAGGSLYRDYNYGKGYPIGTSMKFYMSTSVTGGYPITSLTFIPKAEYIGNVAMTYTAVTKAGKTSTGTINMYCDARTSALKFNDVNASWAVPAVDFTSCWGLVTGSGGSTFNPTGTMQRAMLVTILYRMAGSPSVSGLSNPFKDVPAGTWYTNAVIWASHNGVVNGTGKTTFSPTNPVARQDIASILWRYEGQPSGSAYALNGYTDAGSISSYAKSAMQWAVGAGIITGSGSRLNPQASGTRAEVCVMLYRLLAA